MLVEARPQNWVRGAHSVFSGHHDVVQWHEVEVSECFSRQAAQPVSVNGARGNTAGNGKTEARSVLFIGSRKHSEKSIGGSFSTTEYAGKFGAGRQALGARERCARNCHATSPWSRANVRGRAWLAPWRAFC
jgi:hypothetical protein